MADTVHNSFGGENYAVPDNFDGNKDGNKVVSKYLDLAGLTLFWSKTKDYIDTQDNALYTQVTADLAAEDKALRDYIKTLTVNGQGLDQTNVDSTLKIVISGDDIVVGSKGAEVTGEGEKDFGNTTYADFKVSEAIEDLDDRLDVVQTQLSEGVVSGLIVEPIHDTTEGDADKVWVNVNTVGTPAEGGNPDAYAVGNLKITIDDTAIDSKFEAIDQDIADLEANAGVTNITIKDVDATGNGNKGLVEISMQASKTKVAPVKPADWTGSDEEWNTFAAEFDGTDRTRGDIVITLDETALDAKLDTVDSAIAEEISERQAEIKALAGEGYTSDAANKGTGVWSDSVSYTDITSISNYIDKNESNLRALTPENNVLKINGQTLITTTLPEGAGKQATLAGTNVTLTGTMIARSDSNNQTIADVLTEHDNKLAALVAATEFVGVVNFDPATAVVIENGEDAAGNAKYYVTGDDDVDRYFQNGDIVLSADGKEYILDVNRKVEGVTKPGFVELGDTTAEEQRLTALEAWVDGNYISSTDIDNLFTNNGNKPTFGGSESAE